jgi:hypothetical protein
VQARKLLAATVAALQMALEPRPVLPGEGIEGIEGRKLVKVVGHSDPEPDSPGSLGRFGPRGL